MILPKDNDTIQKVLEKELKHIQRKLKLDPQLRVTWIPDRSRNLSGEVKGKNIIIYEQSEAKAIDTLHHEIVDYYISQAIEPYRKVTNRLIKMINEDAYKRKEEIVETLTGLLKE